MSKDLNVALLLDFYGEMLTDKQRDVIELYYDEDLSLSEIAETSKITRQGVRDSIKRGEQTLYDLEEKLGLVKKFLEISGIFDEINLLSADIYDESKKYSYSDTITDSAAKIQRLIKSGKEII